MVAMTALSLLFPSTITLLVRCDIV